MAEFVDVIIRQWGDVELSLSVMSAAELLHGCWRADSAARRAKREAFVNAVILAIPVIPFSLTVARLFGQLDAGFTAAGNRIPTSDLLIGCTALATGDAVVTGNERHFNRIPGLLVHVLR